MYHHRLMDTTSDEPGDGGRDWPMRSACLISNSASSICINLSLCACCFIHMASAPTTSGKPTASGVGWRARFAAPALSRIPVVARGGSYGKRGRAGHAAC